MGNYIVLKRPLTSLQPSASHERNSLNLLFRVGLIPTLHVPEFRCILACVCWTSLLPRFLFFSWAESTRPMTSSVRQNSRLFPTNSTAARPSFDFGSCSLFFPNRILSSPGVPFLETSLPFKPCWAILPFWFACSKNVSTSCLEDLLCPKPSVRLRRHCGTKNVVHKQISEIPKSWRLSHGTRGRVGLNTNSPTTTSCVSPNCVSLSAAKNGSCAA